MSAACRVLTDLDQQLTEAHAEIAQLRQTVAPTLVTEGLPEHMAEVIIHAPCTRRPVWFGCYDAEYSMWIGEGDIYYRDGQVVAWQRLPPALPNPTQAVPEPHE